MPSPTACRVHVVGLPPRCLPNATTILPAVTIAVALVLPPPPRRRPPVLPIFRAPSPPPPAVTLPLSISIPLAPLLPLPIAFSVCAAAAAPFPRAVPVLVLVTVAILVEVVVGACTLAVVPPAPVPVSTASLVVSVSVPFSLSVSVSGAVAPVAVPLSIPLCPVLTPVPLCVPLSISIPSILVPIPAPARLNTTGARPPSRRAQGRRRLRRWGASRPRWRVLGHKAHAGGMYHSHDDVSTSRAVSPVSKSEAETRTREVVSDTCGCSDKPVSGPDRENHQYCGNKVAGRSAHGRLGQCDSASPAPPPLQHLVPPCAISLAPSLVFPTHALPVMLYLAGTNHDMTPR